MCIRDSFKLAVAVNMMMNVLAAGMEISDEDLKTLRARSVREVKQTNGDVYKRQVPAGLNLRNLNCHRKEDAMKIIETERWVPSKEDPSRSEYIGQRTGQEVFEAVSYTHLPLRWDRRVSPGWPSQRH